MFELVSRVSSFSEAARQAKKTQAAVSTSISNLEIDLGVVLFERTARRLVLTDAGNTLLAEAQVILERCQELNQRADSINQKIETQIRIAIGVPYALISPVLEAFAEAYPYVDVHIKEPFRGDVGEMVMKGDADLGIAFTQPVDATRCKFVQLGKLVMVHVASAKHPLARRVPVSFRDMHRWRRIAFSAHERRIPTIEYLQSPRLWLAESYSAILEATLAGLAWSSLPRRFVRRELEEGKLVELIQQEYPYTDWLVGVDLIWSQQHRLGQAAEWLKAQLIKHKISEKDASGYSTTL